MKDKTHRTLYVLEIPIFNPNENFQTAKDYFKTTKRIELINKAQKSLCDIISLKFNVNKTEDSQKAVRILKKILPHITKPLMINCTENNSLLKTVLVDLIKNLDREAIISFANENTYKEIIPYIIKGNHRIILKSPIDINLCKELNILASELGLPLNKIIMNTDIGGLGYGLDYGYSIIEKIKLENDEYLKLPIISFVAEESLKTKEAKSTHFSKSWGKLSDRANMFEIASASAVKAAGADIIVMYNPQNIEIMRKLDK